MKDHVPQLKSSPEHLPTPCATEALDLLRLAEAEFESERSAVARTLHDEVGGLLVGAVMDLGWVLAREGHSDVVRDKLGRALGLLRGAIDVKRKLVESLRPSLLDDVGLLCTLSWHLKATCGHAGVDVEESYPPEEPSFTADYKIAVFRVFQKALTHALAHDSPAGLSLSVEFDRDSLHMRLVSRLRDSRAPGTPPSSKDNPMRHRIGQLGGTCECVVLAGEPQVHIAIPFCTAEEPASAAAEPVLHP